MTTTTPPVYVIAAPIIKTGWPWDQRIKRIRQLLPDVKLTGWEHLPAAFKAIPRTEQPARLARALVGAVVVAGCLHDRGGSDHAPSRRSPRSSAKARTYTYTPPAR